MIERTKNSGFSLLEAVVYIAILAAMLAVVVNTLLIIGASYRELKTERLILSGARGSLERMTREVRNASDVSSGVFGSNPGSLTLHTYREPDGPTTVEFYIEEGILKVREGGVFAGNLSPPGVSVDDLKFYRVVASSSDAIRIEMTLSASSGLVVKSESFYAGAVIRGSY